MSASTFNDQAKKSVGKDSEKSQTFLDKMREMIQQIEINWECVNQRVGNMTSQWLTDIRENCTNVQVLIDKYSPNDYYTRMLNEQVQNAILGNMHKFDLEY